MQRVMVIAVAVVAVLALATTALIVIPTNDGSGDQPPRKQGFSAGQDAIWLDVVWTAQEHSDAEIQALLHDLEERHFRYAFVYVNSLQSEGIPRPTTYAYASEFISSARRAQSQIKLIAWVGIVNMRDGEGIVDIAQPEIRGNIASFCKELVHDYGFDGVQLDVEPQPSDDSNYLSLLEAVRKEIGPDKVLSIASHKWRPDLPFMDRIDTSYWTSSYYAEVARRVDQMAVMSYDTYLANPKLYELFLRLQMAGITNAVADSEAQVFMGVPTYEEPRPNHDPTTENVQHALRGIIAGLEDGRTDLDRFAGVAIYAHWVTDEAEWATYDTLWLQRADNQ